MKYVAGIRGRCESHTVLRERNDNGERFVAFFGANKLASKSQCMHRKIFKIPAPAHLDAERFHNQIEHTVVHSRFRISASHHFRVAVIARDHSWLP